MTTVVAFVPSNIKPFSFPAILDGVYYNIVVTWNISAQRYYINVYGSDGLWVVTVPLISSPPSRPVASVLYDPFQLILNVEMVSPLLWPLPLSPQGIANPPGTITDYTLEGFQPVTYNGLFRGMQVSPISFTVPMATNPGPLITTGYVSRQLNMLAGIFQTSTLIYRNNAFEIGP
jgi:hypothetical protein